MALPQKVIEQLGRAPVKTPGWSGQLLMFSSTIFFISLVVYLGLIFGYRPYLNAQVKRLNDRIQSLSQQIPLEDQKRIINFYAQLVNLRAILNGHIFTTPIFGWFEKNAHFNVYYTHLGLNTQNRQVTLTGFAKSVNDLAEQLKIFDDDPGVVQMNFGNSNIGQDGFWQFNLALTLTPEMFKAVNP
ncbi:MAG: hypothetical protein HYT13_00890 [Candidatus Liptonbacteria bacterium]|nr:hypothetical protein [Candidatus Liptonbacteria bacterium]